MSTHDVDWRKSSFSGNNDVGECVEVALIFNAFGVRDSKDVSRGHLTLSPAAWSGLLASLGH